MWASFSSAHPAETHSTSCSTIVVAVQLLPCVALVFVLRHRHRSLQRIVGTAKVAAIVPLWHCVAPAGYCHLALGPLRGCTAVVWLLDVLLLETLGQVPLWHLYEVVSRSSGE